MENLKHTIRISNGRASNRGRVQNRTVTWGEFIQRMSRPSIDTEITCAAYEGFTKLAKGSTKAAAGFFFAGHCRDGSRSKDNVEFRSAINLDIDNNLNGDIYEQIKMGAIEDLEFESFVHTTRSHTSKNPRFRIIIPLATEIADPDEYNAVSRLVAERLDTTMHLFDPCSFRLAQMMYMPSICVDQEFIAKRLHGSLCDPSIILEECENWSDLRNLPVAESEKIKIRKIVNAISDGGGDGHLSDPSKKHGIVGAFCRAYSVIDIMHNFMSGVYIASEGRGAASNRFTYAAGSSVNGTVILSGTHLYSHHASDPLTGQALNAWDLLRSYRFGHLDDAAGSYNCPSQLESHAAMIAFANADARVLLELASARISADEFDI